MGIEGLAESFLCAIIFWTQDSGEAVRQEQSASIIQRKNRRRQFHETEKHPGKRVQLVWKRLRRKWRHFVNGVVEYMYIVQHGITPEQLETCEELGVKPWDRVMEFGGSEHER